MFCGRNIWMIVANIFIFHVYASHPMVVVIKKNWNPDVNLTLNSPEFFHMALIIFFDLGILKIHFDTTITVWTAMTNNKIPLSIHLKIKVPNESTPQTISLEFILM